MSDKNKLKKKIESDPDFIYCPRLGNSLKIFLEKYPEGVDDSKIAKILLVEEEDVETIFQSAIVKIRKSMGVEN
jgi:hypothetical protein